MPTYYVRKNGSDSYTTTQAQNASTAWLTIQHALDNLSAGDEVRVGAGAYRETLSTSVGSAGTPIVLRADLDGSLGTGDPGHVFVGNVTDEETQPASSYIVTITGDYYEWHGFVFLPGSTASVICSIIDAVHFQNCVFVSDLQSGDYALQISFGNSAGVAITVDQCVFVGCLRVYYSESSTAEEDWNTSVTNCVFLPGHGAGYLSTNGGPGIYIDRLSGSTYTPGGLTVDSCTFIGKQYAVFADSTSNSTMTNKITLTNNLIVGCQNGFWFSTSSDWPVSSYNRFEGQMQEFTNVSSGTGDVTGMPVCLFGGVADLAFRRTYGWSPFLPFEPIRLEDPSGSGAYSSGSIDSGSTSNTEDLFGNPRPMGGLSTAAADDRGAVEARARPERETTTTYGSSANAVRFEGAGFHDFLIPVNATSTTVTVYARYDSSYSGTLPTLKVMNIPGQSDQTDTMTSGSGTWEQLSASFTPTAAGVARVRIISYDTSASGQSFFDLVSVA